MTRGLNKVMLIGYVGQAPTLRYFQQGDAVLNLSIATNESWKDKQGEVQERTEWHQLVLYKKLAELAAKYIKKGSRLYVEGKLHTRKWQDKETNIEHNITEIHVEEFQLLENKAETPHPTQSQETSALSSDNPKDVHDI